MENNYNYEEAFRVPFEAALERLRKNLLTVPDEADYLYPRVGTIETSFRLYEEDRKCLDPILVFGKYKLGDIKVRYNDTITEGGVKPPFIKRLFGAKPTPIIKHKIQADACKITQKPVYENEKVVRVESFFTFTCDCAPKCPLFTVSYEDGIWIAKSRYCEGANIITGFAQPEKLRVTALAWLAVNSDVMARAITRELNDIKDIDSKSIAKNEAAVDEVCKFLGVTRNEQTKQA